MALEKSCRSFENRLQCKEGVLCPFSFLVGAMRRAAGVSRVSSGGRWQGVCCLGSLLQELIKLCRKQIDLSETQRVEGWSSVMYFQWEQVGEWRKRHTSTTDIHCDQFIPSLVTPSSGASPFYQEEKKHREIIFWWKTLWFKRQSQTTGNSVEGKVPVITPVKFTHACQPCILPHNLQVKTKGNSLETTAQPQYA